MVTRLLAVMELGFLASFWWQTRIDLADWWPRLRTVPVISDYLIPFLYLSDVLLLAVLALWIWLNIGSWQHQWQRGLFKRNIWRCWWFWWLGLLSVTAIGLAINPMRWWGWFGWLKLVEGGLLALYLTGRLRHPAIAFRYAVVLIAGLVITSVILAGEWIAQSSLGLQWLGEWRFNVHTPGIAKITVDGVEYLRPYATFAHPNIAGGMLAIGLAWLAAGWRWPLQSIWWRRTRWLLVALLSIGLLVTFSRSAWLVALALLTWVMWPRQIGIKTVFGWLRQREIPVIGILAGCLILLVMMGPVIVERFASLSTTDVSSFNRRWQLLEIGIELWWRSWWWGIGLRQFVPEVATFGPLYGVGIWRQPIHHVYVLVLAETGVVGFICWIGVQMAVWWQLITKWGLHRADLIGRLLIGSWVAVILLSQVDHYWWTIQQAILAWWLLLGASVAYGRSAAQQARSD